MTGTVTRPSSVPHRRPYTDADLPVLQRTVADWIAAAGRCGYDHIGELPHRISENLAAAALYRSLGFTPRHQTFGYRRRR